MYEDQRWEVPQRREEGALKKIRQASKVPMEVGTWVFPSVALLVSCIPVHLLGWDAGILAFYVRSFNWVNCVY